MGRRFSLPWERDSAGIYAAGGYSIRQNGNAWELRYRGILIHFGVDIAECKREADRHRGIQRSVD